MHEHCHFYCDSCDTVFDVDLPAKPAAPVSRLPKGFKAEHYEIAIHGICPDCAKQEIILTTMSTATETIEGLVKQEYKYGFVHRRGNRVRAAGLERGHHPADFAQEKRAGMADRLAAQGVSPLADDDGTDLGKGPSRTHQLPGHRLLLRAEAKAATGRRASTKLIRSCWRPTRSSAFRCSERERLAGVAVDAVFDSVSVGTTFKKQLAREGHHLLLVQRSGAGASRPGQEISRHGRALHGQFFCRAELRRVHRRFVLLHPQRRALSDGTFDLFPHQRRQDRPVRTHAHRGRRRRARELSRRLHRADARRKPVARGGGRTHRARQRAKSNTPPCRTGIRATRTARAAFTIS